MFCFYPLWILGNSMLLFPLPSSTNVSSKNILKIAKNWNRGFTGQAMQSYFSEKFNVHCDSCTLTYHQKLQKSLNIVFNGVIKKRNRYSYSSTYSFWFLFESSSCWLLKFEGIRIEEWFQFCPCCLSSCCIT